MASNRDSHKDPESPLDPARWTLQELELDDHGRALANGVTDLFASEEWLANFGEYASKTAAMLQRRREARLEDLERQIGEADADVAARIARLEEDRRAGQEADKEHQQPPNPAVAPNVYQAVVRITAKGDRGVGVGGITVRLAANPGSNPLAEAVTDENGNGILAVHERDIGDAETIVVMAVPAGAQARPVILQRSVTPTPSQVDVFQLQLPLKQGQGFETEIAMAQRSAADRRLALASVAERLEHVTAGAAVRRTALEAQLAEFRNFLQPDDTHVPATAPTAPPAAAPRARARRAPASGKRRKKSERA
jgi:hypothetical protein